MKVASIILVFIALLLGGCASPTYEDGTPRDYSDMPWGQPETWEGSVGMPGMSGYE